MRFSHYFGSTLRESPSNIDAVSHQLLLRAGFIRQLGQGLFSYLPLARHSLTKIENLLREEMNSLGGQEMTMPVAHPAEVWQATGRWYSVGPEMARFKDRKERDACLQCGQPLRTSRGVEVGNIFKLGTRYSTAVGAMYLAADGTQKPIVMGSYGIGCGRLLACVAEEHHDDKGLMWPITVAPYAVHLVSLGQAEAADRVYEALLQGGVEVFYDDREESPGVKFNDADLIGIPIRITVSSRSMTKGGVEMKRRDQSKTEIVPEASLVVRLKQEIQALLDQIMSKVVEVQYRAILSNTSQSDPGEN